MSTSNVSSVSVPLSTSGSGLKSTAEFGGRVLLAAIFISLGLSKIGAYAATAGYMQAMGVPRALLSLVIATEA